jgi:hypothetical protein
MTHVRPRSLWPELDGATCPLRCLDGVLPPVWPSKLEPIRPGAVPSPSLWLKPRPSLSAGTLSTTTALEPISALKRCRCKPATALVSGALSAEAPPTPWRCGCRIPSQGVSSAGRRSVACATTAKSVLRRSPSPRRTHSARQTPGRPAGRVSDAGGRARGTGLPALQGSEPRRCCTHRAARGRSA